MLRDSIEAEAMTAETINTQATNREKDIGNIAGRLFDFPPERGDSGGGRAKEYQDLEHYRKGLLDVRTAINQAVRSMDSANSLGLIVDQAGKVSTIRDEKTMTPKEKALYKQIRDQVEAQYGPERDEAYRMLQQIRKEYKKPYDRSIDKEPTAAPPAPAAAPSNIIRYDAQGNRIP
jgi:hypothetical protein